MEIEDFFAQAVDRLLAGESIDDIVVTYAPSMRRELRGLLVVVEAAERMATATVPAPASLNRVSARLLFAQRAAELRAELGANPAPASAVSAHPAGATAGRGPGFWQRLRDGWATLLPPAPLFRLAPLTAVLIIAFLLTFTVVVTAQDSLPGDQIYRLKQWMANQRLATAPPELVVTERRTIAKEQEEDVGKAAEELKSALEPSAIEMIGIVQYLGEEDDFLLFDGLMVTKGYRTDVSDENSWVPMSGNGELQPGISVMLRYQIVPGMKGVVEGIDFEVIPEPPLPTPEPTPTATPLSGGGCQRIQPRAWTPYVVGAGETLSGIAARSTASSDELRRVNCLTNGPLRAGTTIYVPARIAAPPQPLQPVITVTATPSPPVPPATVTPKRTPSAEATATESATDQPGATTTQPAAETPGAGVTASATPTAAPTDATDRPTTETTPIASATPAAPETQTPAGSTATPSSSATPGTPAGSPTADEETATPATAVPATGTATPAISLTPDGSTTPAATATATTLTSATATSTATDAASPAATANASPAATATPTAGASPTAAPAASAPAATATSAPPTATQGVAPTATDVTSSASGGSAATNTPAVAPTATSVPPTATKPPAAAATPVPPAPTATPIPPPPTATQPPPATTAANTSDTGESP